MLIPGYLLSKEKQPPPCPHDFGYSLIELTLVAACMCILLAAAVPGLNRLQEEWTLWSAAHLVQTSLQWGRMYAIAANTPVSMEVDAAGRLFFWSDPITAEPLANSIRNLPKAVRIAAFPKSALKFYPRGNAAPAGTYILQGDAGTYKVIVNIAGRIRLEKV
jgi:Tfp pilus assembly protein FimT